MVEFEDSFSERMAQLEQEDLDRHHCDVLKQSSYLYDDENPSYVDAFQRKLPVLMDMVRGIIDNLKQTTSSTNGSETAAMDIQPVLGCEIIVDLHSDEELMVNELYDSSEMMDLYAINGNDSLNSAEMPNFEETTVSESGLQVLSIYCAHMATKWSPVLDSQPVQDSDMSVEVYYDHFFNWKKKLEEVNYIGGEESYIDDFLFGLKRELGVRVWEHKWKPNTLYGAFRIAEIEENMMKNNVDKVFVEMTEPVLEEGLLSIEATKATQYMFHVRTMISPIDSDADWYEKYASLSSFPYTIEPSNGDNASNWVSGSLTNISKVTAKDFRYEDVVLGDIVTKFPLLSMLEFSPQIFDPGTIFSFKQDCENKGQLHCAGHMVFQVAFSHRLEYVNQASRYRFDNKSKQYSLKQKFGVEGLGQPASETWESHVSNFNRDLYFKDDGTIMFVPGISPLHLIGCAPLNSAEMSGSSVVTLSIAEVMFCFNPDSCCLSENECDHFEFNIDLYVDSAVKGAIYDSTITSSNLGVVVFDVVVHLDLPANSYFFQSVESQVDVLEASALLVFDEVVQLNHTYSQLTWEYHDMETVVTEKVEEALKVECLHSGNLFEELLSTMFIFHPGISSQLDEMFQSFQEQVVDLYAYDVLFDPGGGRNGTVSLSIRDTHPLFDVQRVIHNSLHLFDGFKHSRYGAKRWNNTKHLNDNLLNKIGVSIVTLGDHFSEMFGSNVMNIGLDMCRPKHFWLGLILSGSKHFAQYMFANDVDNVAIATLEDFTWDPGRSVTSFYILEDKDVFEWVGNMILSMVMIRNIRDGKIKVLIEDLLNLDAMSVTFDGLMISIAPRNVAFILIVTDTKGPDFYAWIRLFQARNLWVQLVVSHYFYFQLSSVFVTILIKAMPRTYTSLHGWKCYWDARKAWVLSIGIRGENFKWSPGIAGFVYSYAMPISYCVVPYGLAVPSAYENNVASILLSAAALHCHTYYLSLCELDHVAMQMTQMLQLIDNVAYTNVLQLKNEYSGVGCLLFSAYLWIMSNVKADYNLLQTSIVLVNLKGFVWDPGRDFYRNSVRCKMESPAAILKIGNSIPGLQMNMEEHWGNQHLGFWFGDKGHCVCLTPALMLALFHVSCDSYFMWQFHIQKGRDKLQLLSLCFHLASFSAFQDSCCVLSCSILILWLVVLAYTNAMEGAAISRCYMGSWCLFFDHLEDKAVFKGEGVVMNDIFIIILYVIPDLYIYSFMTSLN